MGDSTLIPAIGTQNSSGPCRSVVFSCEPPYHQHYLVYLTAHRAFDGILSQALEGCYQRLSVSPPLIEVYNVPSSAPQWAIKSPPIAALVGTRADEDLDMLSLDVIDRASTLRSVLILESGTT